MQFFAKIGPRQRSASIASSCIAALLLCGSLVGFVGTQAASADAVSAVGGLTFSAGNDTTSLAISPQHVGDLLVLFTKADASGITVSSVSGGGVNTWTRAISYSGYSNHELELWIGTVKTVGASTLAVSFSASVASTYTGLASEEFSATGGASTIWSVDSSSGISNGSSSSVSFPKLTPSATSELYFSYAAVANTALAGTTSGFTYQPTSDGDIVAYDTTVSGPEQAAATQSPSGVAGAVAILVMATTTAPVAPSVTSLSPTSGPTNGGTSVTVTGTSFTGATAVKFGSVPATSFSVTSATSLSAVAPAGSSGPVDVTVTTSAGTSPTSSADTFTYSGVAIVLQEAAGFPLNSESVMNPSITVNPQKVGDLMILSDQLHSTSVYVAGVSGGNASTWHLAQEFVDTSNTLTYQVWYAVAIAAGSAQINLTYSATTTLPVELIADSFTASRAVTWNVVTGNGVSNGVSTIVQFPKLTSGSAPAGLYWGASEEHQTGVAGSTPGFTYGATTNNNEYLYNANLAGNSTYSPTAGQMPSDVSTAVGVIFSAS